MILTVVAAGQITGRSQMRRIKKKDSMYPRGRCCLERKNLKQNKNESNKTKAYKWNVEMCKYVVV